MINPQWLQTFAILAELGSFTRTAEHIGITQAAVSQHIRHLEAQYGTLLLRRPRQIELTPTGNILLTYCREIEQADKCLNLRLTKACEDSGDVSVISPGSIGLLLYPLLLDLQCANKGLSIHHRFAPDSDVLEAVLSNQAELGFLTFKPDDPRITASHFSKEPLELVAPAHQKACHWEELVRLGFIDHPDGQAMATRLLSRRFPANADISSIPCHGFSNQVSLILEPVARGLGFTVIPRYARQAFKHQEAISVVECGATVVDTIWLIHRAEWPLSARAAQTVHYLRQQMAKQA